MKSRLSSGPIKQSVKAYFGQKNKTGKKKVTREEKARQKDVQASGTKGENGKSPGISLSQPGKIASIRGDNCQKQQFISPKNTATALRSYVFVPRILLI